MNYQTDSPYTLDEASMGDVADINSLELSWRNQQISISKRIFDVGAALLVGLIFAPLILMIYIVIRAADGGPGIYRQKRIGKDGQEFGCLKFRTMGCDSDKVLNRILATDAQAAAEWARDQKLKNDPRITKMGCFLRKSSLDELPQLWNILKGDMSLVGPRPIVRSEIPKYGRFYPAYISVLPGVTGLWQISGRNDTGYKERVELDVEYVSTQSFWKDVKIIFKTIPVVLSAHGAY